MIAPWPIVTPVPTLTSPDPRTASSCTLLPSPIDTDPLSPFHVTRRSTKKVQNHSRSGTRRGRVVVAVVMVRERHGGTRLLSCFSLPRTHTKHKTCHPSIHAVAVSFYPRPPPRPLFQTGNHTSPRGKNRKEPDKPIYIHPTQAARVSSSSIFHDGKLRYRSCLRCCYFILLHTCTLTDDHRPMNQNRPFSPLITAPYQTEAPSDTSTSPIKVALGATQASLATVGAEAASGMSCRCRETVFRIVGGQKRAPLKARKKKQNSRAPHNANKGRFRVRKGEGQASGRRVGTNPVRGEGRRVDRQGWVGGLWWDVVLLCISVIQYLGTTHPVFV